MFKTKNFTESRSLFRRPSPEAQPMGSTGPTGLQIRFHFQCAEITVK
jgi:hypothetical protein